MRQHPPPTLSYNSQSPRQRRPIHPRILWKLATVLALLVLAARYVPTVISLAVSAYNQHQWSQYHAAPGTIVMDMSAIAPPPDSDGMYAIFSPTPPELLSFPLLTNDPEHGMLFLGRLTSPNGTQFWTGLAFDQVCGIWPSPRPGEGCFSEVAVRGCTLTVGTFFHPAEIVWFGDGPRILRVNPNCHGLFRFYAGQPDPANPSRFTIDYTYDGKPGTIDGQVLDSGVIVLTPRTGVVVQRPGIRYWSPVPTPLP